MSRGLLRPKMSTGLYSELLEAILEATRNFIRKIPRKMSLVDFFLNLLRSKRFRFYTAGHSKQDMFPLWKWIPSKRLHAGIFAWPWQLYFWFQHIIILHEFEFVEKTLLPGKGWLMPCDLRFSKFSSKEYFLTTFYNITYKRINREYKEKVAKRIKSHSKFCKTALRLLAIALHVQGMR